MSANYDKEDRLMEEKVAKLERRIEALEEEVRWLRNTTRPEPVFEEGLVVGAPTDHEGLLVVGDHDGG